MIVNKHSIPRLLFAAGAFAILTGLAVLGVAGFGLSPSADPALATHVAPVQAGGNPDCADLQGAGQTWTQFKLEGATLTNGVHSDGKLAVTISNYSGTSFNWSSNIGVDAVFVKAANGGNVYRYDPPSEATQDTGLVGPTNLTSGQPYGTSHISFCYDVESPTPTPTPTATPAPTATPTPTPAVLGVTALPATGGEAGEGGMSTLVMALIAAGTALAMGGGLYLALQPRRYRDRRD